MGAHPDRVGIAVAAALGSAGAVITVASGAVPVADAVQALMVPCLFLIAGLIGPLWAASRFACRCLVGIGALHLLGIAAAAAALRTGSPLWHLVAQLLYTAGFAVLVPLSAGYPNGPAPRWAMVTAAAACLLPIAGAFSAPTPAVLFAGPTAPLLGPVAAVLPAPVAAASSAVLLLPVVAIVVAVVRAARGGREVRGRLLVPLIGLALFVAVLAAGSTLPLAAQPIATTLFLVSAPLVPAGLVLGARPLVHPVDPPVPTASVAVHAPQLEGLSARQREVLAAMAEGRSNADIAGTLHMSLSSVEKHTSAIFQRLGLPADASTHRRVAAVVAYLRASR